MFNSKFFLSIMLIAVTAAALCFLISAYGNTVDIKAQNEQLLEIARFDEAMRFVEIIKAEQLNAKATTGEWIQPRDYISYHTSSFNKWKVQSSLAIDDNAGAPAYVFVTIVRSDPYDTRSFTVYQDSTIRFQ